MTKMKKETMNHDREIDDFLKCNHENIDFKSLNKKNVVGENYASK